VESSGVSNTFKSSRSPAEIRKAWAELEGVSVFVELTGRTFCAGASKTPVKIEKKRDKTECRNIFYPWVFRRSSSGYFVVDWTAVVATAGGVVSGRIGIVKFGVLDGVSHNAENVGARSQK